MRQFYRQLQPASRTVTSHHPLTALFGLVMMSATVIQASAQSGPSVVAYAWASNPTSASYTPNSGYAYNPAGAMTITRSSAGTYQVTFSGLGNYMGYDDIQVGGQGNAQVTGYGTQGHCKLASVSYGTDVNVNVNCYDTDGLKADANYSVLFLYPGSNPVDLGFALALDPTTASYAANKLVSYSSTGRDVSITRSSTGVYVVSFAGLGSAFPANAVGVGGHAQVSAYGPNNAFCQIQSWGPVSGNLNVGVQCYSSMTPTDTEFSLLVVGRDTDFGGIGFAYANQESSASYTPSSTWSHNDGGGAMVATRSGVGVYGMSFANLGTLAISGAGSGGNVQVSAYGGGAATRCNVSSWGASSASVRCYSGSGEFHAPWDSKYDVMLLYRQDKATDTGIVDFDSYSDGTVLTTVSGEPVSFPNSVEIEQCSYTAANCLRAWSGNRVALGPVGFEFDRDPIVMEFSSPQSTVSAHINGYNQNGQAFGNVTMTAYRAGNVAIGSDVVSFDAAPAWGTMLSFTQDPGSAEIVRVEIVPQNASDWIYIDDLSYDDQTILPVELAAFGGVADGLDVRFKWTTLSEDALAGFRIERTNGNDWTSISELIPAVSPSGGDYALTVRNALSAGTRFRLTSVDVDGTLAFSDVLEVSAALVDDYLVSDAFPNPFTATASIEVRVRDAQSVRVDLYDVLGRHVRTLDDATRSAGDQFSVAIERDGLAAGQYFVRVKGERFIETRTVVIAR